VTNNIYDKKRVEVKDIVGTVFVQSESQGYIRRFMDESKGYHSYSASDMSTESLMAKSAVTD
jgi:hypothetical protein